MVARNGRLARFRRDERGSLGAFFGLALIPSLMIVGSAVDYGHVLAQRAKLQAAADAAAVAGASPADINEAQRTNLALTMFSANLSATTLAGTVPTVSVVGDLVTVDVSLDVKTPFLSFANVPTLPATAAATAQGAIGTVTSTGAGKICLLALDPNSDDGIHLQGANQIKYLDCWAHTNSTKPTAINAAGNVATAEGTGHCAVGGWTQSHTAFSPQPTSGCLTAPDPYAHTGAYDPTGYAPKFTPPALATTCKQQNANFKKGEWTLDPGRYCGGIDIKAQATVTLNPGIYYIDNGVFNVQSGATVTGSNVLLYFAGANAKMTVIGGGTVDLSGRTTSSSYAGFLVIAHPDANRGGESNIQGGGTFKLQGVVYMPTQRIEVSGNGDVNDATVSVFGMVAKDFYFRGNGVFNAKKWGGSGNVPDILPNVPVATTVRKTLMK